LVGFFSNFDGYQQFKPRHVFRPTSEADIANVVRTASSKGSKVKVFGAGTVWNAIGVTNDNLILLDRYNKVLEINQDAKTVRVQVSALYCYS
jgi:L-gulonolactone oxidase